MHILLYDHDTGEPKQLAEHELLQQHLQGLDQGFFEIFAWDEEHKRFLRAAVSMRPDDPQTLEPIWSPI